MLRGAHTPLTATGLLAAAFTLSGCAGSLTATVPARNTAAASETSAASSATRTTAHSAASTIYLPPPATATTMAGCGMTAQELTAVSTSPWTLSATEGPTNCTFANKQLEIVSQAETEPLGGVATAFVRAADKCGTVQGVTTTVNSTLSGASVCRTPRTVVMATASRNSFVHANGGNTTGAPLTDADAAAIADTLTKLIPLIETQH